MTEARSANRERLVRAALLTLGSLVGLGLAEAISRWLLPDAYYVWRPGYSRVFHPDPEIIHGFEGSSTVTINSLGIRGDPFAESQRYRLLAVGGSTTIGGYLDDSETWAHGVQRGLEASFGPGTAWVGNVGRPGHTTVQHALQVEKLTRQHPEIDAVILLIGLNDLLAHIIVHRDPASIADFKEHYADRPSDAPLRQAFSLFPGMTASGARYQRTGLWRLWTTRSWKPSPERRGRVVFDDRGTHVAKMRTFRREAAELRGLPDLSRALDAYARRVEEIIAAARAEEVRVIFMTQPTLWRGDLSPAERDLLWMGGPRIEEQEPGSWFYSVEALAEGMELYNRRLLEVCVAQGVECLDLAAGLPKTATIHWDDAHFTEEGARRVAALVTEFLRVREPFVSYGAGPS